MGRFKDALIEDMNVHQVQKIVDEHRGINDLGYVKFLEEQLKKAEEKIENMHKIIGKGKNPKHCVECFKEIKKNEIICGKCQDERDGRFDHLRQ